MRASDSLWGFMGSTTVYGSVWVSLTACRGLWELVTIYVCLLGSLIDCTGLWVSITISGSLWVSMIDCRGSEFANYNKKLLCSTTSVLVVALNLYSNQSKLEITASATVENNECFNTRRDLNRFQERRTCPIPAEAHSFCCRTRSDVDGH